MACFEPPTLEPPLSNAQKKIHFIRHAEGYHNVETASTGSIACLRRGDCPAKEHPLWDARLTPKGIRQAEELREYLANRPSGGRSFTAFDLVVVSPLTRTLETAVVSRCMTSAMAPPSPSRAREHHPMPGMRSLSEGRSAIPGSTPSHSTHFDKGAVRCARAVPALCEK